MRRIKLLTVIMTNKILFFFLEAALIDCVVTGSALVNFSKFLVTIQPQIYADVFLCV